jgi:hypothetical protein
MSDTLKVQKDWEPTVRALSDSLNRNLKDIRTELAKTNREEVRLFDYISYDTAFTVVVTIAVFIFGFLIDRTVKFVERQSERKKLREFYADNVASMAVKLFPKINKLYRDFYLMHDLETGMPMTPPKVLAGDIERLEKIDFDKLYVAFKNKNALSAAMSQLDFISKATGEVEIYHKQVHSENQVARTIYQKMLNDYFDLLSDYLLHERSTNPAHATERTFILINSLIFHYHSELAGKRALKRFYKEILRPIQIELVDTKKYEAHQIGAAIARLGKDLSHKYNELRMTSIEIRLQYRQIYFQIKESIDKLNEVVKDLK